MGYDLFPRTTGSRKILESFPRVQRQAPARIHDLIVLLAKCVEFEGELENLEEDCRRLTVFAVGSRYPDDLFEPSREDAMGMVEAAKRVREQVLKHLPVRMD